MEPKKIASKKFVFRLFAGSLKPRNVKVVILENETQHEPIKEKQLKLEHPKPNIYFGEVDLTKKHDWIHKELVYKYKVVVEGTPRESELKVLKQSVDTHRDIFSASDPDAHKSYLEEILNNVSESNIESVLSELEQAAIFNRDCVNPDNCQHIQNVMKNLFRKEGVSEYELLILGIVWINLEDTISTEEPVIDAPSYLIESVCKLIDKYSKSESIPDAFKKSLLPFKRCILDLQSNRPRDGKVRETVRSYETRTLERTPNAAKTMTITFNAVARYQSGKGIKLKITNKTQPKKPVVEITSKEFKKYVDLHFGKDVWLLATTEVRLTEGEHYDVSWEIEYTGAFKMSAAGKMAVHVDNLSSTLSVVIYEKYYNAQSSASAEQIIQGSVILLDKHLQAKADIGDGDVAKRLKAINSDGDVAKRLEAINKCNNLKIARNCINKWLERRIGDSSQNICMLYVLHKLKIASTNPFSKEISAVFLEALRCQQTLPEHLQLSGDLRDWLLKGAQSSSLDKLYYLSQHVSLEDVFNYTKTSNWDIDINETNLVDVAERITEVISQLYSNTQCQDGEAKLFEILRCIVSNIRTVGVMIECIVWFQQDKIQTQVKERQAVWKCLSKCAYDLLMKANSNDWKHLDNLVTSFLQPICQYLNNPQNMCIFEKLCSITTSHKLQHIVKFLHSGWLILILPKMSETHQRNLLSKLSSFITKCEPDELEEDEFFYRYRVAIAPSLLDDQSRSKFSEEVINEYEEEVFSCKVSYDRLKMCFYGEPIDFNENELIYVTHHIMRSTSSVQDKIGYLADIFVQVTKPASLSTGSRITLNHMVATSLINEMEDIYRTEKFSMSADLYFKIMLTIQTSWDFIFTDSILEAQRDRFLNVLRDIYQKQKEKRCSFAHADFLKRMRKDVHDFEEFINVLQGQVFGSCDSIQPSWWDVIDNIITNVDNHRANVTHLNRLVKLIVHLTNRTAIGIDTTKLQKELETLEERTTIGSEYLIPSTNEDQFWGSFQSALKFSDIFKFANSSVFTNICFDYFKTCKSVISLDDFLRAVNVVCISCYKERWKNIAENGLEMKVCDVDIVLCGITKHPDTLSRELKIIKKTNLQSLSGELEAALQNLICRKKYQEFQGVFKIFKMQDSDGIPEVLTSNEMDKISLLQLHKAIQWIDSKFDNENNLLILAELSKCGDVVDFLIPIIENEEDLRNLGDIIQEHDRSSLHIGLVAEIIDVKRFIQSLLDIKGHDKMDQLIKRIKEVRHDHKSALSSKLNACRFNLFSIKELYTKLADRQETTRVIVRKTVENGTFSFGLQTDNSSYVSEISYEISTGAKRYLSIDDLQDSKSRALLAVNSEINEVLSSDDVVRYKRFIKMITDATCVTDVLNNLYNSGHFEYVYNICETSCPRVDCKSEDLNCLLETLKKKYEIWVDVLSEVREECYYLNFFDGNRLLILEQLLKRFNRSPKSTFETILKQLDLNYTQVNVNNDELVVLFRGKDYLDWNVESNVLRYEEALRERLIKLGRSLETHLKADTGEPFRSFETDSLEDTGEVYTGTVRLLFTSDAAQKPEPNIKHRVQSGTISLVAIKEKQSHPISVLLQLYKDTTGKFPKQWQVLFCQQDTLMEEAKLFLQRCWAASKKEQDALFTIVNAELLSLDVRSYIMDEIKAVSKKDEPFMLAIIISDHQTEANFVEKFGSKVTVTHSTGLSRDQMVNYLGKKWGKFEIVTSETPGLGKTEYVKSRAFNENLEVVNVNVFGSISRESLIKQFSQLTITKNTMLHIDVGIVSNPQIFNTFILELTVFGIVKGRQHVFSLDTNYICVEIANQSTATRGGNPYENNVISFLSIFKRKHMEWKNFDDYRVSNEINSSVQVVCHYLDAVEQNLLDSEDIRFVGEKKKTPLATPVCRKHLKKKFKHVPKHRMSFVLVEIYLNVFAVELRSLSASKFLSTDTIKETADEQKVRSQFFHELDKIAMEFTPLSPAKSHKSSVEQVDTSVEKEDTSVEQQEETEVTVTKIMKWEDSNHTLLVFNSQDIQTVTPFYRKVGAVEKSIKTLLESQLNKKLPDYENETNHELKHILEKVCRTSRYRLDEPKFDYALTPDNLLKMILIYKRIMAGIPVIIMGETGCGKTLLLTYLAYICEVPFYPMDIHAGTSRNDIKKFIEKPIEKAEQTKSGQEAKSCMVWVFFDEINTCDHLGLLSEIMLKKTCEGRKLPANLVFLAACNPYIVRKQGPLKTSGGLGGKCHHDEKSNLVYRVEQLPKQMLPYVWDFGALQEKDEKQYISEMMKTIQAEIGDDKLLDIFSEAVSKLQTFTREIEGNKYCVSLRDIRRCIELTSFFVSQWFDKKELAEIKKHLPYVEQTQFRSENGAAELQNERKLRSIILALVHCYYCRIIEDQRNDARSEFRNIVSNCFIKYKQYQYVTQNYVEAVIIGEQNDLLNKMDIPKGVAKNSALRENVFVILICILAHIPVFIVGNPGSSKSLSMQLINSNLRGLDSTTEFFKKLPAVMVLSYQGSESSTSEGIIKIFHKAQKLFQEDTQSSRVLPVVLLDEVGLAEHSPNKPLKVLHSLLEPKHDSEILASQVSVVGISNWALDPAKMNRAVYLSRVNPSEDDLYKTAETIRDVNNKHSDHISEGLLKSIARAYTKYNETTKHKLHGLRDYYSLINYISVADIKDDRQSDIEQDTDTILERGIRRNFGGYRSDQSDDSMASRCADLKLIDGGERKSNSTLQMIAENVCDEMARHLMIITDVTDEDLLRSLLEQQLKGREYKIIFGSHFQNDTSEDYFYRVLSNIILYMEQGVTIVLKGLKSIYGSLYDMLNQNYTVVGGKKSCRIALGPIRSPLCEVHKDFRCIVLIDEHEVDTTDPPFLNRFEKQFLTLSDVLSHEQKEAEEQMLLWIERFRIIEENGPNPEYEEAKDNQKIIKETGAFLGFNNNTVTSYIVSIMASKEVTCGEGVELCKSKLLSLLHPVGLLRASRSKISVESPEELEDIENRYMKLPHHNGLLDFLKTSHSASSEPSMTIIYTHSSIHADIKNMVNTEISVYVKRLSGYRSEREFTEMVRDFWLKDQGETSDTLILQCSPHVDGPRMSSARYLIHDCKQEIMKTQGKEKMQKHVCIIVHVDRRETDFSDFSWQFSFLQGWDQVTIDSLSSPAYPFNTIASKTVLQLIEDGVVNFEKIAIEELNWALSCIRYIHKQDVENISEVNRTNIAKSNILSLLKANLIKNKNSPSLPAFLEPQERYGWLSLVACDVHLLSIYGTFDATVKETMQVKIRRILAKYLFFIASNSAWIDVSSCDSDTFDFWKSCIQSSDILDICSSSIPEPMGPASFIICNKPLRLHFPLFMVFHERIEKQMKQCREIIDRTTSDPDTDFDISDSLLLTLEDAVKKAVYEDRFHNFLDQHVDTFLNDLYAVFASNLHEPLPKERFQLLQMFLKTEFKSMTNKYEKAVSKVAVVYFHMLTAKDILLAKLQLISTYIECSITSISPDDWQGKTIDKIVENVCELTLPSRDVLAFVGGSSAWKKKATSVILCAAKVAQDTSCIVQFLSLCRSFCTLLQHFKEGDFQLANLADLGKTVKDTIATREVFTFIHNQIAHFKTQARDNFSVQMIEDFFGAFFIRAFDADPDDCFLTTALEEIFNNEARTPVFASTLLFRIIERDAKDGVRPGDSLFVTGCEIIINSNCIDQNQFPNLSELENFLRQQQEIDNPVAVLCCDLINRIFFRQLNIDEEIEVDHISVSVVAIAQKSVSVVAESKKCTMRVIFSIAFISALFKTLVNVPKEDLEMRWVHIFRSSLKEDKIGKDRVIASKIYFLKHLRQKYSMREVVDFCGQLQVLPSASQLSPTNVNYSPMSYVESFGKVNEIWQKFEDDSDTRTNELAFDDIVIRAKSQDQTALALSAIIIEHFMIYRSNHTDQFMERVARKIEANVKRKEFSHFIRLLLEKTILSDFITFADKCESEVGKVLHQVSVIAHILSIVLVYADKESFFQCLYPKMSTMLPVSGTPVPTLSADIIEIPESCMAICPSCNIQVVGSQNLKISESKELPAGEQQRCPVCQGRLSQVQMSVLYQNANRGVSSKFTTGYYKRSSEELTRTDLSIRTVHPIAYRVISIITHSIFLVGHYINPEENEELLKLFDLHDEGSEHSDASMKIRTFLFEQIDQDWNTLQILLQRNIENTAIFLHSVIKKSSSDILKNPQSFETISFETQFSKLIADVHRSKYLQNFRTRSFRCTDETNDIDLEFEIDELCEKSSLQLRRFFRYKHDHSFTSFKMEVLNNMHFSDELAEKHMFLCLVVSMKDQLESLHHIIPIIDWYRLVFNKLSHRIKKQDAKRSIKEIIDSGVLGSSSHEHFSRFKDSWNALERNWRIITGNNPTFGHMSDERELVDLLDQSEDRLGHLKTILNILVEIQNHFLLKAHFIATSGRCLALKMQMDDDGIAALETIPLSEHAESKKEIILFTWDDRFLYNAYTNAKKGDNINYNYEAIERQLCTKLVLNKKLLTTKHPFFRFGFLDELLAEFTNLLQDITSAIPQEQISMQIQEDIRSHYQPGEEKSKKVFERIQIVLSFLRLSGGDPKCPLHEYTSNLYFDSETNDLSSEPFKTLQLCHVVHLYELFEDIMATPDLLQLSSEVCKPVEIESSTKFERKLEKLDIKDIGSLSSVVRTFAYRYLQSSVVDVVKITLPLADALLKIKSDLGEIIRRIPEEVQVQHTRDAITIIEKQLKDLRQSSEPAQVQQSLETDGPKPRRQRGRRNKNSNPLDIM